MPPEIAAPPPPEVTAPGDVSGLAGGLSGDLTDAGVVNAASAAGIQAAAPPPTPLHSKIADGIIHAFAGTDGSAGSALRSALAGGLAGLAAASRTNFKPGSAALGGLGVGATAAINQAQQQRQQALENQQKQTAQQQEATRQQYLNAETQARTVADQKAADRLDEEATQKRVTSGQAVAAAYGNHRTALGTGLTAEEILPEAGAGGKYDHTKVTAIPTGTTTMFEGGKEHTVPTFTLYPRTAEDVKVTPEVANVLKEGGYNYPEGTKINGDLLDSLTTKAMAAQTSASLLEDAANKAKLSKEATDAALQKKSDLTAVNPYLGAHPDDPITALGQLSGQVDPRTKQPTPAAQSAQRLLASYDQKELETHRHNVADEKAKQEENRLKEVAAKGNFTGNPQAANPQAFLASLPPDEQSIVTLIGTGKAPLSNPGYLIARKPEVLEAVAKAYPDFDTSKVVSYQQTYKDFTSGKASVALNAGGTALGHLRELEQLNTPESHIPHTPAWTAYQNKATTLSTELAKFYGDATIPAIDAIKDTLTSTLPGNRQAAIATQAQSMGRKLDAYEQQWTNAAPSKVYQAPMPGISAEAKQARAALDPQYAATHPEYGQRKTAALPPPTQGFTRLNVPGKGPMDFPDGNVDAAIKNGATKIQ